MTVSEIIQQDKSDASTNDSSVKMIEKKNYSEIVDQEMVNPIEGEDEDIFIGKNTALSGVFRTSRTMFVEGFLDKASINAQHIALSEGGVIHGSIDCYTAELAGQYRGDIRAENSLVIRSSADIDGVINCGDLIIHRGAKLNSSFKVSGNSNHNNKQVNKKRESRKFKKLYAYILIYSFGLISGLAISSIVFGIRVLDTMFPQ